MDPASCAGMTAEGVARATHFRLSSHEKAGTQPATPLMASELIPTYAVASRGHRSWTSWICNENAAPAHGAARLLLLASRRGSFYPIRHGDQGAASADFERLGRPLVHRKFASRFRSLARAIRKKSRVECRVDFAPRLAAKRGRAERQIPFAAFSTSST